MDAVNSPNEWDEAFGRLLAYLERIDPWSAERRTRIALHILERARERKKSEPEKTAQRVVMDVAFGELEQWFAEILPPGTEQPLAAGILAYRLSEAGRRWPDVLLAREIPDELRRDMARIPLRATPDMSFSSMTSREMDYGAMETIAHETWQQFAWAPILRAAALWTAIFFLVLYGYDYFFAHP